MIKVLHTLDSLNRGGAEMLALEICRNASRFGIDLTFVAAGGGSLERDFEKSGADFIKVAREYPVDLNLVWELRKLIRKKGIQIAHGYQPIEMLHLYLAGLRNNGLKLVQSHQGFLDGWKNRSAAKFVSTRVNANVVCSRGLFPWLRHEVGLDTSTGYYLIHNAVDASRLEPSESSVRAELGLAESDLLMGMVANFVPTPRKDQLTVCRALPAVFEKHPNARFVFAGTIIPGAEEYFERCIAICDDEGIGDKVFFLGPREDIADVLAALDLFVFSSLHEGLPLAVIEAMIAGVPVIVSDIEPLLEVTNNGKCGEIFQRRNSVDLAEKINALLDNPKLREKRSNDARDFAENNFLIDSHLRSLSLLYKELLEG